MDAVIKINCDNAAFEDDPTSEVARILRDIADRVHGDTGFSPGRDYTLRDANGNEVGFCTVYANVALTMGEKD